MHELTAAEITERRSQLESRAATALGRMLFEFSRLDMNLGLCLAWVDSGSRLEEQTKAVESMTLNAKLDELTKHAAAKLPAGSKGHAAYLSWIEQAHAVRQHRNVLVHGRWGVEPDGSKVVNVLGLPTSQAQRVTKYSIEELVAISDEIAALQVELDRMRTRWAL